MDELEKEVWETRLEWAESSDHPLSESVRLAARMVLEKTDEHQDRPRGQTFLPVDTTEG